MSKAYPTSDKPDLNIFWMDEPEEHDYEAAFEYVSLVLGYDNAGHSYNALQSDTLKTRKAKDILRASGLPSLTTANGHVKKNLAKIRDGKHLSPILLVVDILASRLIIADGYHRLSTVYLLDEDIEIPCKIIEVER